jgi:hypothetical protein
MPGFWNRSRSKKYKKFCVLGLGAARDNNKLFSLIRGAVESGSFLMNVTLSTDCEPPVGST